tara:strand:+ start:934 stop:1512 length:579 start_codon:yes stop_codon:yes gene_type:complete
MKLDFIKKTEFWQRALVLSLIATVFTLVLQNGYKDNQLRLERLRSDINNEFTNELMWMRFNDYDTRTEEMLVNQGRLEGMVNYLSGDSQEMYAGLWHDGYDRGLSQTEFEADMVANNSFKQGYISAMKEAFPDRPEFQSLGTDDIQLINENPREVKAVIKKPEFDVKAGQELKDSEELRQELNREINQSVGK